MLGSGEKAGYLGVALASASASIALSSWPAVVLALASLGAWLWKEYRNEHRTATLLMAEVSAVKLKQVSMSEALTRLQNKVGIK